MISGLTRLGPGDLGLRCESIFGRPETGSPPRLRLLGLGPTRFPRRLNRCPMTNEPELELDAESNSAGELDKHLSKRSPSDAARCLHWSISRPRSKSLPWSVMSARFRQMTEFCIRDRVPGSHVASAHFVPVACWASLQVNRSPGLCSKSAGAAGGHRQSPPNLTYRGPVRGIHNR